MRFLIPLSIPILLLSTASNGAGVSPKPGIFASPCQSAPYLRVSRVLSKDSRTTMLLEGASEESIAQSFLSFSLHDRAGRELAYYEAFTRIVDESVKTTATFSEYTSTTYQHNNRFHVAISKGSDKIILEYSWRGWQVSEGPVTEEHCRFKETDSSPVTLLVATDIELQTAASAFGLDLLGQYRLVASSPNYNVSLAFEPSELLVSKAEKNPDRLVFLLSQGKNSIVKESVDFFHVPGVSELQYDTLSSSGMIHTFAKQGHTAIVRVELHMKIMGRETKSERTYRFQNLESGGIDLIINESLHIEGDRVSKPVPAIFQFDKSHRTN